MDELFFQQQFLTINHYEGGFLYTQYPQSVHFPAYFGYFPSYYHPEAYMVQALNLYIPANQQPQAKIKVLDSSSFIPNDGIKCQSEMKFGSKKPKRKCGFFPPRLVNRPSREADFQLHGKTSLMIKNIPNHLRRGELLQMLDQHCSTENRKYWQNSKHAYDFVYLPMDFGFGLNLGFAFVNFATCEAASRFFEAFNKKEWKCTQSSDKICEITIAKIQGKDGFIQQFHSSTFPCDSDEYLPVLFSPPSNGLNDSNPVLVGRRTRVSQVASNVAKVMIMTQRKNRKS